MTTPTVTFIVPVRNDAARLGVCLKSIMANGAGGARVQIIVVDNESTDGSGDVARRAGATVLRSGASSVAELRNRAATQAPGEILAFVDADHEISSAWVTAALASFRVADVAAAGALCLAPIDGTWVQRAYGLLRGIPRGHHDVEWLGSGNLAIRREVFQAVSGFDASLTACEDVDLCNRVRAAGGRIVSNADMRNVHYGDPATLRAVFKGELWRGRDNLRVSFRTRTSWKSLVSAVLPVIDLTLLAVAVAATVGAPIYGPTSLWIALGALATVVTGAALRPLRTWRREGSRIRALALLQTWLVACAYDLGRALALVTRAPHRSAPSEVVAAQ